MSNIFEVQVEIDPLMTGWETAPVETDIEEGLRLSWTRTVGDSEFHIWAIGFLDEYTIGLTVENLATGDMLELQSWSDREQIDKILLGKLFLIQSMFESEAMEWLETHDEDLEGEF